MVPDPVIVDANSLIMRCVMASAPEEIRLGLPFTGGVYGALNSLRYVLSRPEVKAGRVIACFDHAPPPRRKRLIPGYKADRESDARLGPFETVEQKRAAMAQLWTVWELFELLGVTCLRYREREGDDVVAAVARVQLERRRPIVVTGDSDLWQVVGWGARVWDLREQEMIRPDNFLARAGVPTDCYVLYRALVGGKDGIRGARGVGPAKAAAIIENAHWDVRGSRAPLGQLAGLCAALGRSQGSKAERRLVVDRRRLERTIRGIDLWASFGSEAALEALRARLRRRVQPDPRAFLRRCRDLGFRAVLQNPFRYVRPFVPGATLKRQGRR